MAAAVAGIAARGTTWIDHPRAFEISYPRFLDDLTALHSAPGGS
jgi:5-enolpyruvylshikimate-3-phosphate synthase